ncbi:MAG TPA: hypothetical protein VK399_14760 [Longimicrobiaceae bacterium]|nr:hypothetical protein [Longimicrobiaceae bacterium]
MDALVINGLVVPVARDTATRDVDDGVHRARAISGRGISTRRAPKLVVPAKTVAMEPPAAAALEAELRKPVVTAAGRLVGGVERQCHVEMRPVPSLSGGGRELSVFDFTLHEV